MRIFDRAGCFIDSGEFHGQQRVIASPDIDTTLSISCRCHKSLERIIAGGKRFLKRNLGSTLVPGRDADNHILAEFGKILVCCRRTIVGTDIDTQRHIEYDRFAGGLGIVVYLAGSEHNIVSLKCSATGDKLCIARYAVIRYRIIGTLYALAGSFIDIDHLSCKFRIATHDTHDMGSVCTRRGISGK